LTTSYEGSPRGEGVRVALVCARFNDLITDRLRTGALDALRGHGVDDASITEAWVPGAFEIPLTAQQLASSGDVDAVICLGAVVRGGTGHYEFVAGECASGIARVQLDTGVPVMFGVLTTDNVEQALDRSLPDASNKGAEAAVAALEMVDLLRQLPKGAS
jgi:6,7-dimethyl-8-ribityllumazine synthase